MVADDDMTAAGRAWMRGELPSEEYFALVRREARREARRHVWRSRRRARAGWWARLRRLRGERRG